MREEFVLKNVENGTMVSNGNCQVLNSSAAIPEETQQLLAANLELGKASADPNFLQIVMKQTEWRTMNLPKRIEDDGQMKLMQNLFGEMKTKLNELEKIRLSKVSFPTKVVNLINSLFRQVREGIKKDQDFVGNLISTRHEELKREADAVKQEMEQIQEGPAVLQSNAIDVGIGKFQFDPQNIAPPEKTVITEDGVKVRMREDVEITVINLGDFLKSLVSQADGNKWLNEAAVELVSVNTQAIKKLLKENPGKRKIPGLKIVRGSKAV